MAENVEVQAYKVKKEDNFWNIVKAAGFPPNDWKKIFNTSYNKKFKALLKKENRTPDKIFPGKIIYLPRYNKADIKAKIVESGKLSKSIRSGTMLILKLLWAIGKLKLEKEADLDAKKAVLKKLEKEYKRVNDAIYKSNGPGPMQGPGEKARQVWARYYLRHSEGVFKMKKEIKRLRGNLDSSKFEVSIETLEAQAKLVQKNLKLAAKAYEKCEAELVKMQKTPY